MDKKINARLEENELLEEIKNIGFDTTSRSRWCIAIYNYACLVDKKFSEIPLDCLATKNTLGLLFQLGEQRMGIRSIYLHFCKHRETYPEVRFAEAGDL